jgi:hypothetical protein
MISRFICLIFIGFLFGGCSTTIPPIENVPKVLNVYGFNFTEYSKKGFLFTPYGISNNYPLTVYGYEISGFAIKRLGAFKREQDSLIIKNEIFSPGK